MPAIPIIGGIAKVATVVGSVKGAVDSFKGAKNQQSAAQGQIANPTQAPQVDIQALDTQVREIARKNAIDSMALEQELTPEVASLRKQSIEGLLGDIAPDQYSEALRGQLFGDFNNQQAQTPVGRSSLSQAAYDRIAQDLAAGGNLPMDVRNAVLRRSAATAGRVGGGALDLTHDLGARDLGLTSLDLLNQRIAAAQGAGGAADQFNLAARAQQIQDQQNVLNNRLNSAGLISNLGNQDFNRRMAIANLGQSINQPVVGLDPGSVASVAIGNQNALQAYLANQQALAGQAANAKSAATGQLIGAIPGVINAGTDLYNVFNKTTATPGYTPTYTNLPAFDTTLGTVCWVARSVYGEDNPKWKQFRSWLLTKAPESLRSAYIRTGENFAKWLDKHPDRKPEIRGWMDAILEGSAA